MSAFTEPEHKIQHPGALIKKIDVATLLAEVTRLTLTTVSGGDSLDSQMVESSRVQRPGLALAGYFEHIRPGRVELFGETELKFLATLSGDRQQYVLDNIAEQNRCLFVISKDLDIPEPLIAAAEKFNIPVIKTAESTVQTNNELSYYLDYALAEETTIHGVCVEVFGLGIVITGKSGIGKSECALELVKRGQRLVADDIIYLKRRQHYLVGTCDELLCNYIELRGVGVLDLSRMFGITAIRPRKKIDLFIDFVDFAEWNKQDNVDRLGLTDNKRTILGVAVPEAICPVSPGRNMAELVELVAKNHMMRLLGHDSTKVFSESVAAKAQQKRLSKKGEKL